MISAVVLAKNEEGNIGECLKSLAWADEILVINDGSTDKTSEIAEKLGAKVIIHPLNNDYSAQRNFGLEKANGEWILFIDADERVSPKLAEEIKNKIANKQDIDGYFLKREDTLFGKVLKHGETAGVRLLRLGKKEAGKWKGKVHETWKIEGEVMELENPLEHYPHPAISEFLEQINVYSTLRAQELYDQGVKTNLFFILAYTKGKFLQDYFLKLGFLDGMPGLIVALLMSFHSFLVRSKLYLLWKQKNQ
jgi:glycosyltransferase involved in cell wall biosynthesis